MVVLMWNSLPGESVDPAINEIRKECTYFFKNQDEAKEYFMSRGESYDEDKLYLAVHYSAR